MDLKSVIRLLILLCGWSALSAADVMAKSVSDADLRKVEEQVRQQSEEHQKLQEQAASIESELRKVNREMISTAKAIQNSEDKLSRMEKQLDVLKNELKTAQDNFLQTDENIVKTLSALQNLAMKPTESLLVQPLSPVNIIRSAIVLRETVPYLDGEAQQIKNYYSELNTKRLKVERQIAEIAKQKKIMQNEHSKMKKLAQTKANLKNRVEKRSKQAKRNMEMLASQAKDLRDLLQKIENQRQKRLAEKRKLEEKQSTDLIKSKLDSINNMSSGFAKAKGSLSLPVRGRIVSHYGEQQNGGMFSKGLTLSTRSHAQVVAPFDGTVVFAGPFRSYGDMIIVEHDGGYLSLLAGLGSIDVEMGQMLLAGEPVGVMPDDTSAKLYIEIRKDNQPINPAAWFKI